MFKDRLELCEFLNKIETSSQGAYEIVENGSLGLRGKGPIDSFANVRSNVFLDKSQHKVSGKAIFSVQNIGNKPNSIDFPLLYFHVRYDRTCYIGVNLSKILNIL